MHHPDNLLTRERLEADLAGNPDGFYLDHHYARAAVRHEFRPFRDLDAAHAAGFLRALGYQDVEHADRGTNGRASTPCGVHLSTNGYICRR